MCFRNVALPAVTALALLCSSVSYGQTAGCATVPPINANGTFLSNFLNSCYTFTFPAGFTDGKNAGDLTETYAGFFYNVNPGYEVLIVGEFPQSRYLNIAADDSHFYTQQSFYDAQLTPLSSSYVNPFLPGVTYQPNQLYAVALQFGGTQPANIQAGCGYGAGLNFYANVVDGTKRHPGVSWNGSPLVYPGFPPHDDVGPNISGMVTVRQYLNDTSSSAYSGLASPVAFVRDLSTGCAVPLANAVANNPSNVLPSQVVTNNQTVATNWITPTAEQIWAHKAPLEAVKKSKPPKNATFPQLEASQEALQRVLARRPMLSNPPTGSWCRFLAFFHSFLRSRLCNRDLADGRYGAQIMNGLLGNKSYIVSRRVVNPVPVVQLGDPAVSQCQACLDIAIEIRRKQIVISALGARVYHEALPVRR
jgi:hypothetical protein